MWVLLTAIVIIGLWFLLRHKGTAVSAPTPGKAHGGRPFEVTAQISGPRAIATEPVSTGSSELKWFGKGSTLAVAGFRLRDPNVYSSAGVPGSYPWATDPSEILLSAEVRRPRGAMPEMGYWPWYSRIEPEHRYVYLEWLASGRHALPPLEGLLFLYFYGLERRLLLDEQDKEWVLREVVRLRKLDEPRVGTREGRSFRTYSSGLLWFEGARSPDLFDLSTFEKICALTESWNESMISAPLAWLARRQHPLSADMALRVARLDARSIQSVVTKRVGNQFGELFRKRYTDKFGDGLMLKAPKRTAKHTYRPASGGLSEFACKIADPAGLPSQFEPLAALWNSCVDDLRGLSRVSAPAGGVLTVDAWEAMPPDLRDGVDHPLAGRVHEIVSSARARGDDQDAHVCLMPAGSLAVVVGIETPQKLTGGQSRRISEVLHHAGYGMEPDARVTGRPYVWEDPVAVFARSDDADVDAARYLGATCVLRLGLTIAEADGAVDPEELRRLGEQIDAVFQLPAHERQRLEALRSVLLKTGPDLGAVSKRLESALTPAARRSVGRLLVAIAASNGTIDRKELTALRKCFRALDLGPEVLDQTMSELDPAAGTGFVTVAGASGGATGEALPPRAGLTLNREAISAIMSETREVAKLLADAMVEQPEPGAESAGGAAVAVRPVVATAVANGTPTAAPPPARFAAFLAELSTKEKWPRAEADALARQHRVMLAGAIEGLNEWALDHRGRPLIDESDEALAIDRSVL